MDQTIAVSLNPRPSPSGSRVAWGLLLLIASADILSTVIGIRSCLSEQNPVAAWVIATFGPAGLIGLKTLALGVLAATVSQLPERYGWAALGGFGATQFAAVGWNVFLISSLSSLCG